MTELKSLRPSAMPIFMNCPESAYGEGEIEIKEDHEMRQIGLAGHDFLKVYGETGEKLSVEALAETYGISDLKLLRISLTIACKAFHWLQDNGYEFLVFEQPGYRMHFWGSNMGTSDVIAKKGKSLAIIDWKFGFSEADYIYQLKDYGVIFQNEDYEDLITVQVNIQSQTMDIDRHSWDDIAAFSLKIDENVVNPFFKAGKHCTFCPRANDCKARRHLIQNAGKALIDEDFKAMEPQKMAELYEQSRVLKRELEKFEKAFKQEIDLNGPIQLADGSRYEFRDEERSKIFFNPDSEDLLSKMGFSKYDFAEIGITKLRDMIMDSAENGNKAQLWRGVFDRLKSMGVVHTQAIKKVCKKKGDKIEGK